MYYKTSTFSLLVGEVTTKAMRDLQVSPGFGEYFISASKAHSRRPGASSSPEDTNGLDIVARGGRMLPPGPWGPLCWLAKSSGGHIHGREPLPTPELGQPKTLCKANALHHIVTF